MQTSHILLAGVLTAASLGGLAFAATPIDAPGPASAPADNWLTIPEIYNQVVSAGYRDIPEIEREGDGYEIKAVGADGERVKLFVDPMTGGVLDTRSKDRTSDK
jgi:hypothetical protein